MKNVAILGSTGSIGRSALEVIAAPHSGCRAVALVANGSCAQLEAQAAEFRPEVVVVADNAAAANHDWSRLPTGCELLVGQEAVEQVVARDDVDMVLSAIVGSAGLRGTWAALQAGKSVALANKETLVVGGELIMQLAASRSAALLPVDSEHSAVFQAMQSGRREEVRRIVLTASGGPLREWPLERLCEVTIEQALAHPNWSMGPKITIDSATMMNKALEIIEARWLFDLSVDQIDVVIHPQSVIHSLVEFVDGSMIGQLGPPDMKLPIHYALHYPERCAGIAPRLDLSRAMQLDFIPPDEERFPALALGREVAMAGGTAGAVLNAANEVAVAGFLAGELKFTEIIPTCRSVLEHHDHESHPTLERLLEVDRWARQEVSRWSCL